MSTVAISDVDAAAALHVPVDADEATINRAFRAAVSLRHPDHGGDLSGTQMRHLRASRDQLRARARRTRVEPVTFEALVACAPNPFTEMTWPQATSTIDIHL